MSALTVIDGQVLNPVAVDGIRHATHATLQVGGAVLGTCSYGSHPGSETLALQDIHSLASLQQLLAALLPAGMPLVGIVIKHGGTAAEGQHGSPLSPLLAQPLSINGCTQLAMLKSFLDGLVREPKDGQLLDEMLKVLMAQATQLRRLSLVSCMTDQLPQSIVSATALRQLSLRDCGLTGLSGGPYFERLQHLSIRGNSYAELPQALTQASRLRQLTADASSTSEADVQAVLVHLPTLKCVIFQGQPSPHVVERIRIATPAIKLQMSDASQAALDRTVTPWASCAGTFYVPQLGSEQAGRPFSHEAARLSDCLQVIVGGKAVPLPA